MERSSVIAIGASSGGVVALCSLAAKLPRTIGVPVLMALHVGSQPSQLPALLNKAGRLTAKHAEDGEQLLPGRIYVAPPDRHMIVADGGRLQLSRGPKENCARPAIDPLFRSVAAHYGPAAVGVILTGNLNDGTLGLLEIARRGGITIGQDPGDAPYPEMPRSAAENVALDYTLRLSEMPKLRAELASRRDEREKVMPIASSQSRIGHQPVIAPLRPFARPVAITCPDCGGALETAEVGATMKLECHIGHTYTAATMAVGQFDKMERMMRAAVRFLNERAEFCLRMAESTYALEPDLSTAWNAASRQALDRAYKLRDLVEQDWLTPESERGPPR